MEDNKPVIKITPKDWTSSTVELTSHTPHKLAEPAAVGPVVITHSDGRPITVEPESMFNGNDYIRKLVFNTTTKEDYTAYSKEDMQTANLAVLNKVVARFMKLKPNEFAEMIKSELDGKAWFR